MFLRIYLWMFLFVSVCEEKLLTCTVDHQHIIAPPFFQSVASARQEGELRLGDYGHGESQAC